MHWRLWQNWFQCWQNTEEVKKEKIMYKAFLIKYAEIGIKGKNRHLFEDALVRQICYALRSVDGTFHVHKQQGRVFVETEGDYDYEETIEALSHVFGITGICPAVMVEDEGFDKLAEQVVSYMDQIYPDKHMTFKVSGLRRMGLFSLAAGLIVLWLTLG